MTLITKMKLKKKQQHMYFLTGVIPDVDAGIAKISMCARFLANPCHRRYTSCVKNCGLYRVYYLMASSALERHCFGEIFVSAIKVNSFTCFNINLYPFFTSGSISLTGYKIK